MTANDDAKIYPTVRQVYAADHIQLARWARFLPSPGFSYDPEGAFDHLEMHAVTIAERATPNLIMDRLAFHGGITPAVSKTIGF